MRVIYVDDEAPARRKLKRYIEAHSNWQIVAEAKDVDDAVEAIKTKQPDVILLDIQLTNGTGFDVLQRLPSPWPKVVFITAYDHYAVQAFDVHAQDYLLKPLQQSRFVEMVQTIENHTSDQHALERQLQTVLKQLPAQYPERILLNEGDRAFYRKVNHLLYVLSEGNYLRYHFSDAEYLLRGTLSQLKQNLDPSQFQQINRSTIVHIEAIQEIQTWFKGERMLIMQDGQKLKVSSKFWKQFKHL